MTSPAQGGLVAFTSHWRQKFIEHLQWLAPRHEVIHLGYCGHANPGDNAISLAEDRLLRDAGISVKARVTDIDLELRYDATEALVRANPGLPILFRGGGTLNDVYPPTGDRHARIIEAFPDRPILEAAVSIHFSKLTSADRLRRAIGRHRHFRLLARDDQSHAWAREYLDCQVSLVPDAVLTGDPRPRKAPQRRRIGTVVRDDLEVSSERGAVPTGPHIPWKSEPRALHEPRLLPARLRSRLQGPNALTSRIEPYAARGRVARVVRLLSEYDAVVGDGLHVTLMCIMAGIPVVAVDNSYGKVGATFRTWNLESLAQARLADEFTEALSIARRWVT